MRILHLFYFSPTHCDGLTTGKFGIGAKLGQIRLSIPCGFAVRLRCGGNRTSSQIRGCVTFLRTGGTKTFCIYNQIVYVARGISCFFPLS